ncbi:MAG: hypothetical protein Tsb0018_09260 [Opitutales bacterium]|tara:strand:- start:781 stop:1107 length:327 start_codon:yes stop_codon:yes gene_type:complete
MSRIGGPSPSNQSVANAAAAAGDMRDLLRKVDTDDQDRRDMNQDRTETHDLGKQSKTSLKKMDSDKEMEDTTNKSVEDLSVDEDISEEDAKRNSNMSFLVQQKKKYRV